MIFDYCRHCGKLIEPSIGDTTWEHINGNIECYPEDDDNMTEAEP